MIIGQLSEEEGRLKLLGVKEELGKEGFKTSWRDPFSEWLHTSPSGRKKAAHQFGDILYIPDPPVPKIPPFDISTIEIRIDAQISFQLSLYYYKVLEEAIDAEVIDRIYAQHASSWAPAVATYFYDISLQFSLNWETEYDIYIEDSLCRFFPVGSTNQVISLVRAIRNNFLGQS